LSEGLGLRAFISGCESASLTARERDFFRDARPCGLILFTRNCAGAEQVKRLTAEFYDCVGDERAFVLIDQEGGRVQRLGPPNWRCYPPAARFGELYRRDAARGVEAARAGARLIARDLGALGITVNCAPVLDLPVANAHDIIGDRAYGADAEAVAVLGRAVAEGYLEGGVLPVIKHIPGHGRAAVDSHASLPVIGCSRQELSATDFQPFRALRDMPLAMTAHILIPAIDPERPSSASPVIIGDVIRGDIGFDGLLMCDDLGMNALSGDMAARACAVLQAGCDVALHCSGRFGEMQAVASAAPELSAEAARRFHSARARLNPAQAFEEARAEALLAEVLGEIA
jgi:beta-N-acetylhexosaminidase